MKTKTEQDPQQFM